MEHLTRLAVPCPPAVEQAIAYRGDCRYVGFYWEPGGDEVIHTDGLTTSTGNWRTYLALIDHPKVAIQLFGQMCTHSTSTAVDPVCDRCQNKGWFSWDFGDSEHVGTHILLLDRQERVWYGGDRRAVSQHLHEQHPPAAPLVLSSEEWQALVQGLEARMQAAQQSHTELLRSGQWQAAIEQRRQEEVQQRLNLIQWLNQYGEVEDAIAS